ncbi:MAG TPA: TorF family putative porin [Caulobacter sp.]|nr:TorF family putative porin [Caulobacter sp.]
MAAFSAHRRFAAGAVAALGATLAAGAAAAAAEKDWSVKLTAASEYISKGTGKSGGDPALQVDAAYDFGPVTAGVWASNAEVSQGGDSELQLYVASEHELGPVKIDLRGMLKHMPGTDEAFQDSWFEARADATVPVAGTDLRLRVEYSPDNYAATEAAWWVELQASRKLAEGWKASAAYGVREQDGGADYRAWNAGVTWRATDRLAFDLRWYDTDSHQRGENYDGRAYVSATLSF